MHKQLSPLGRMVDGYKKHGWRTHSLNALLEGPLDAFLTRISVYGNIDLVVQQGETSVVMIAGRSEAAVRNIGQSLTMGAMRFRQLEGESSRVVVALTLPFIPSIQHNGIGDVYAYDINQDEVVLGMLGAGTIQAWGKANAIAVALSGEGSIDTSGLQSQLVIAKLSGIGPVKVYAAAELDSDISGVGDVLVLGSPPLVNASSGGSGAVVRV